jgi:hypothetical protein
MNPGRQREPHEVNERIVAARKLVHEHLTASMIMVPLDEPIDAAWSVGEGLKYLERQGFDLALLNREDVRIVYREQLKSVPPAKRNQRVTSYSASPRANRLVEHTLDFGEVAKRLIDDRIPLLVVGRNGLEHIRHSLGLHPPCRSGGDPRGDRRSRCGTRRFPASTRP